jgi:hypothetical protein
MGRVDLRFYPDPETGEPHIYDHGITEEEVQAVLEDPSEERPGKNNARVAIGATEAGRILRVIYTRDPVPGSVFVITAYDLRGKPLVAYRRRQRRKTRRR